MAVPKKKLSRKELLKEPEVVQTLQEKAVEWLQANQRTAIICTVAVLVAAGLLLGIYRFNASQESQAMALYSGAQQRLAQLFGQGGTGDMRQAAAALKAVSDKYPNTKAAAYAQLERANLLYGAGQAKEAAAIYEGVLGRLKAQDPLTLLAKQGLGYCRFAANDLAGAQKIFSELAAVKSAAGTAQLNLGLIYERQGKLKEAVEAYRKAAAEAGGSEATLANARLEALTPGKGA